MKPIIGLTPSWDNENKRLAVPQDYIFAVLDAGGTPVVIPPMEDAAQLCDALDRCDALLLSGGDDVCPTLYGEEILPICGDLTHERDHSEPILIRHAIEKDLPILGICRGMQILNAALGGSLYQDLAEQYGKDILHPRHDIPGGDAHSMRYVPGTALRAVMGVDESMVNSRHHQAVKKLAPGMKANAIAPDGLIEGMEAEDGRPILAVQWHPETIQRRLPEQLNIFKWLVREASK